MWGEEADTVGGGADGRVSGELDGEGEPFRPSTKSSVSLLLNV
jgi:hypothetical protein